MATSDWFVNLSKEKTKPPKKEFQIQGSVAYKKDGDSVSFRVDVGYEVTQDIESDNTLALVFSAKDTDINSSGFTENDYIGIFMMIRKKDTFGEFTVVSCGTKKGV